MSDLKLNGITPDGIGKIKLGSTDVQKIYSASTLVWPTSIDPGEVQICSYIWTTTNSTETELIAGGNIQISTSYAQMLGAYNSGQPAACYYNFDENESYRGLFYNIYARSVIKPPTGFRLPTGVDFSNLTFDSSCNPNIPNQNTHGAPLPNNYREDYLTDTQFLGDSGFNAYGYGQGFSSGQFFSFNETYATWWTSLTGSGSRWSIRAASTSAFLGATSWASSSTELANLRFVKNA